METVKEILNRKGSVVWTIGPEETVFDAIRRMDEYRVGALMVVEGEKLVGIITERDYARKIILKGRESKHTRVGEIMTHRVTHVAPDDSVEHCVRMMTERHIRHLPVVEERKLVGILSMRDLLASRAAMNDFVMRQLN